MVRSTLVRDFGVETAGATRGAQTGSSSHSDECPRRRRLFMVGGRQQKVAFGHRHAVIAGAFEPALAEQTAGQRVVRHRETGPVHRRSHHDHVRGRIVDAPDRPQGVTLAREPCIPICRHARAVEQRRGSPVAHRRLRAWRAHRIGPFVREPPRGVRHQGRTPEADFHFRHALHILWVPDRGRQTERQPGMGLAAAGRAAGRARRSRRRGWTSPATAVPDGRRVRGFRRRGSRTPPERRGGSSHRPRSTEARGSGARHSAKAERGFETANVLRHRRLREVQLARRLGEGKVPCGGLERAKPSERRQDLSWREDSTRNQHISIINATPEDLTFVNSSAGVQPLAHVPMAGRLR